MTTQMAQPKSFRVVLADTNGVTTLRIDGKSLKTEKALYEYIRRSTEYLTFAAWGIDCDTWLVEVKNGTKELNIIDDDVYQRVCSRFGMVAVA